MADDKFETHQQDRQRPGNARGGMTGEKTAGGGGAMRGAGKGDRDGDGREGVGDTDHGTAGMGRAT